MNCRRWWQGAVRLMRGAPLVIGMTPFLMTAAISAQVATPGVGAVCQDVIEHDVAAQTQRLLADCVTDETISIANGWTFDGDGHTVFALDPPGGRLHGAVLFIGEGAGDVQDVVIDGSRLEELCLIDRGVSSLGGLVFLNSTGEAQHVTVRNMDRVFPRHEEPYANDLSQLESCGTGIAILGEESQVTAAASIVSDVGYTGVLVEYGAATISNNAIVRAADAGVLALSGAYVRVTPGNQISYGNNGIQFEGEGTSGRIAGNTIAQMRGAGVVVMAGAHASLADNLITDVTQRGVVVTSSSTASSERDEIARVEQAFAVLSGDLRVSDAVLSECHVGVAAVDGSSAEVTGGSVRECAYGMGAVGGGSRLVATKTLITESAEAGVGAESGGTATVSDVRITQSTVGISATGQSQIDAANVHVADTAQAGLVVSSRSTANVRASAFINPGLFGLLAVEPGSALTVDGSTIKNATDAGVEVISGAQFTADDLRIYTSEVGVHVRDAGSAAAVRDIFVSGTQTHLLLEGGAQASVTRLFSTGGDQGVVVRGPGSRVTLQESAIARTAQEGVLATSGGWTSVTSSSFEETGETAIQLEGVNLAMPAVTLEMTETGCVPEMLTIPAGVRTRLIMRNGSSEAREVDASAIGGRFTLAPGEVREIIVVSAPTEIPLYCRAPASGGSTQAVVLRALPAEDVARYTLPADPLLLHGNEIRGSRNGIRISGGLSATISENTIEQVPGDGIVIGAGTTATVRDNSLSTLGEAGILVEDGAQVSTTGNRISNTRTWGIHYTGGDTSGTASRNQISGAGMAGIGVSNSARATLQENEITGGTGYGVAVQGDGTSASVHQNSFDSVPVGIRIADGAIATISENSVHQPAEIGIEVAAAAATLTSNVVSGPGATGILTSEQASVHLIGNLLTGADSEDAISSPATGIEVMEGTTGTLRGNTISGFRAVGGCGLALPSPEPAGLHVTNSRFPAPGNDQDVCLHEPAAGHPEATPVAVRA